MSVKIRPFREGDADALVAVLKLNGQYDHPEVEGPAAMGRVAVCEAAVFLVAEVETQPRGLIRGVYDGSRAMIHLLSVHPAVQGRGIGRRLLAAAEKEMRRRGASSLSVTTTEVRDGFWEKMGFRHLPVHLMLKDQL